MRLKRFLFSALTILPNTKTASIKYSLADTTIRNSSFSLLLLFLSWALKWYFIYFLLRFGVRLKETKYLSTSMNTEQNVILMRCIENSPAECHSIPCTKRGYMDFEQANKKKEDNNPWMGELYYTNINESG